MTITFSTTDCCEVHGSASENWTEDEITASVVLQCAWTDRYALLADILGNHKAWPYNGAARATSAGLAMLASLPTTDGQGYQYETAQISFNYSTKQDEEIISESLEPTVEFLTLDHKKFRWDSQAGDPLLEGEAPALQIKGLKLKRTYHKVETIPPEILTLQGSVNDADYVSSLLGLTFPEETLLFEPATLERSITTAGAQAWKVTLSFSFKKETWNKFPRMKTQQWEEIIVADDGAVYKPYPPDDFSSLLS